MYFKDSINRPRAEEVQPADGVHVHIHSQDALRRRFSAVKT